MNDKYRTYDDRYGVSDRVSRDGTDVHIVITLDGADATTGLFECVVEPAINIDDDSPWIKKGEREYNNTDRYDPV